MRLIGFLFLFFTYPTFFVKADMFEDWQLPVKDPQFDQDSCVHPDLRSPASVSTRLRASLRREFVGQHIVQDLIHFTISAHLEDPAPSKPLVLSLHGFPKDERRQLTRLIADSMYFRGKGSKYMRIYSLHKIEGSFFYQMGNMLRELLEKSKLELEIEKGCYTSLVILDLDQSPEQTLAGLAKARSLISQPDYNKHIFIFVSSVGAKEIRDISYKNWKNGNGRENLDYRHFHTMLKHIAYNASTSSWTEDKGLIDWYVPLLPLTRQLIISCIKMEARKIGMTETEIEEETEKIADMVYYWPVDEKVFATTSCKKVEALVRLQHSKTTSPKNELCVRTGADEDNETNSKKNQTEEQGK